MEDKCHAEQRRGKECRTEPEKLKNIKLMKKCGYVARSYKEKKYTMTKCS